MKTLALALILPLCALAETPTEMAEVSVRFSPKGGCEAEIVDHIAHARMQIRAQYYSFSSKPIIEALIAAKRRGVDVAVTLDKKWNTAAPAGKDALKAGGVPVTLDGHHRIMHDKFTIVDFAWVLTGSYNPTFQAEHYNAENLVTMRNAELAGIYLANWNHHAAEP